MDHAVRHGSAFLRTREAGRKAGQVGDMKNAAGATVRAWMREDAPAMRGIWNAVVDEAVAFPQEQPLTPDGALEFFAAQSHCGVALDEAGAVAGLYVLHPNNVGRCGHIANASYAVAPDRRGRGLGEALVRDSLREAARLGFRILQFNAVGADNAGARQLYEKLGFHLLGIVPGGYRRKDGSYADICLYWRATDDSTAR